MCDFNEYDIFDENDNKVDYKEIGSISHYKDDNFTGEAGLWHVGSSGCGKYYYDGENWHSPYSKDSTYKFVIKGQNLPLGVKFLD